MEFPQYRKLNGFNRYYKIISERVFIETYLQSEKQVTIEIKAEQYPEILRIKDMLDCAFSYVEMDQLEIHTYFDHISAS